MCLGHSPVHNRNAALVLNVDTGRVSPQFQVKFDRRFHTVIHNLIESKWQRQDGFIDHPSTTKEPNLQQTRKRDRPPNPTSVSEGVAPSQSSRVESRNKHDDLNLGEKAPHSSRAASRLRNDDIKHCKRVTKNKSTKQKIEW